MSMIITTTTSRASASGARDRSYTSGFGEPVTQDHSYLPLPRARAFRLLEFPKILVPTTELRCNLRTVDFDAADRPPYTTLSASLYISPMKQPVRFFRRGWTDQCTPHQSSRGPRCHASASPKLQHGRSLSL